MTTNTLRVELALITCLVLSVVSPAAAQQQAAPGSATPSHKAGAATKGVHEKTNELFNRVSPDQPGVLATDVVTTRATVVSVDRTKRVVALKNEDGVEMDRAVAPDVDLAKLKAGDRVTVNEIASVAVFVSRGATAAPAAGRKVDVVTAKPGEKPARLTVDTEEISATIATIDHATHRATLRNADGSMRTIQVNPGVDLRDYEVGDQVTLRLTKAVAVAVEPAK